MIDEHYQETDASLARELAHRTGALLLARQHANGRLTSSGQWVGDDADVEANTFLIDGIRRARPDDAILSEESPDDLARLGSERTWIIDPLDGSGGFGRGRGDWAVHVALTVDGTPTAAGVAVPSLDRTFSTADIQVRPPTKRAPIVVVGRSRALTVDADVAAALDGELLVCGSAGVKAMLVVVGDADVYVHGSPLHEWDVCAPAAIAEAAGLAVSDRMGDRFCFNRHPRPVVDGLVICAPDLHDTVIECMTIA